MIEDKIIDYYKMKGSFKEKYNFSLNNIGAFNSNPGLGDCILLTSLIKEVDCFSTSKFWKDICFLTKKQNETLIAEKPYFFIEKLNEIGCGNGHIINSVQRGFLGKTELKPKGFLGERKNNLKNKIGLSFTTGNSYKDLINHGYKTPRQLYKNTLQEIVKFIETSNNYSFVEFGGERQIYNDKVKNMTGISITESLLELSTCDYFIGVNSGFMNAAAAFDIKSIIIINVPTIDKVYLPLLNTNILAVHDLCWLYPQNVHLHQDGENELVPLANCDNIKKAINGEVYPFWSEKYLELINYDLTISR